MMNDNLIKPFEILDLNQCPKCRGRLKLYETEMSVRDLSKTGIPIIDTDVTDVEVELVCTGCGETYEVKKKGVHYFIPIEGDIVTNRRKKKKIKEFNPFYS